jgi:hypothetical protein
MESLIRWFAWILILLSGVAFLFAVLSVVVRLDVMGLSPESYSRACSNLALLAIALWFVGVKKGSKKD